MTGTLAAVIAEAPAWLGTPHHQHAWLKGIKVDDAAGECTIRVNENQVFGFTGDTRNGGTAAASSTSGTAEGRRWIRSRSRTAGER